MINLDTEFRMLQRMVPLDLIVPLQSSFEIQLPNINSKSVIDPFPSELPRIIGFGSEIEVMHSLQRPKKIVMKASDGKRYIFLCKPKDDLRKDCRLMEFNSVINKLLRKKSVSRERDLHINTYCVMPLNEECGLIEWVNGTIGFRQICTTLYQMKDQGLPSKKLREIMTYKISDKKRFLEYLLPKYPSIFREWFTDTFTDPSTWYRARNAYCRTTAVISIVGYVLGLGDRHGENILFDRRTGETLHVDFNCLFEKGLTFEKPEKVPFRLTHNMVDAFGITGYEGSFRKSCEITMRILRENKNTLMTILETFIHDPLVEWSKSRKYSRTEQDNVFAVKSLAVIERKLTGIVQDGIPLSVEGQVQELIQQATSIDNLSQMYVGWAPFM